MAKSKIKKWVMPAWMEPFRERLGQQQTRGCIVIDIKGLTGKTDMELIDFSFRLSYPDLLGILRALDRAMDLLCKSTPTDEVHSLIHECARATVVITEKIMAQLSDDSR